LFYRYQMTKASCIGSNATTGYQLKSRTSKIVILLGLLICLSIQSSTANQRYGRSRETYTRSARSVNVPRETYTRSARTIIEPYSRETYTRSARSSRSIASHQNNQLKETDSQLRNLVQVLSKLALHVPKGYPKGSWMNREDSLQRYLQIHDQKQGGKNDMLEHLDKGKLLKSKDLGPFAKLYAIQSFAAPEENQFTEEDEDITLRSMIGSPPLKGWLWNGGRTAGVRLTK